MLRKRLRMSGNLIRIGSIASPVCIIIMLLFTGTAALASSDSEKLPMSTIPLPLPLITQTPNDTPETDHAIVLQIKAHDTLSSIFHQIGLNNHQLISTLALGEIVAPLSQLTPHHPLSITLDENGNLKELVYGLDFAKALKIVRLDNQLHATIDKKTIEKRLGYAHVLIHNSLFEDGNKQHLSDHLLNEIVTIFGWDIDFARDVRPGDSFDILYDEYFVDGELVKTGAIEAAEFVNKGNQYKAVEFTTADGTKDYFTPEGKSLRKAFLRTPVKFTRISSRFSTHRNHPILHMIRAHKGVDYAAPLGTPAKATSDGKIIHVGWKGGYGRAVIIKLNEKYSTLYGHLSRFAENLKVGTPVKQGQIIGYVGESGLATAPHLHYEFRIHNVHYDPLTVDLPKATPIAANNLQKFLQHANEIIAIMDTYNATANIGSEHV